MKAPPIDQVVYECMFPKPKSTDPPNFQGLLQRQLVPEVRLETQAFYGHLASQEAKYPGLDYSHQPHRVRLSRYTWHRRLFRAFDNLGLTESEIANLTKWEGTRWAKERFEREQGITIRDTTADGIADWVEPKDRLPTVSQPRRVGVEDMEDVQEDVEEDEENDMDEEDDSDTEIHSVGIELNERLRAAVALREAGNVATVMDEEYEQWLKEAAEAGGLSFLASDLGLSPNANHTGTRPATEGSSMHPRLLNAARLGQWQQIPDVLQSIVRENAEANVRQAPQTSGTLRSTPLPPLLSRPSLAPRARATSNSTASPYGRFTSNPSFLENFTTQSTPSVPSNTSVLGRSSRVSIARDGPQESSS